MCDTKIMGVLNLTPDSFYDGNTKLFSDIDLLNDKIDLFKYADIIDVGCESSRPGANSISIKEELKRLSVLNKIRIKNKILSIDSYKPKIIEYW